MADRDELKRAAAERAVEFVESGMVLGLGTGSTAAFFVEALAARVGQGLSVIAIPTSERTAAQAHRLGIPLGGFAEHRQIDIAIDGADEVQRTSLDLIKGRGGALLREKIVAAATGSARRDRCRSRSRSSAGRQRARGSKNSIPARNCAAPVRANPSSPTAAISSWTACSLRSKTQRKPNSESTRLSASSRMGSSSGAARR